MMRHFLLFPPNAGNRFAAVGTFAINDTVAPNLEAIAFNE
jgi:2-methylaconitate cis-trans-isomerase PrpF